MPQSWLPIVAESSHSYPGVMRAQAPRSFTYWLQRGSSSPQFVVLLSGTWKPP